MKLSEHSKNRIFHSFDRWEVDQEYSQRVYEYLVHGFEPGSFYTCVFANDLISAMLHSHPSNTVPALKRLAGWISNCMPLEAWGSADRVRTWLKLSDSQRREVLEHAGLIFSSEEEMWMILKNEQLLPVYKMHT